MPESWQIRSTSRALVVVLSGSTIAHNRWRTVASESGRDFARASKVPKNLADFRLLEPFEVRSEKRFFLSGDKRGSHKVPRQEQGSSISTHGGSFL